MVDPDNRRPVNYRLRAALLDWLRGRESEDRTVLAADLAREPQNRAIRDPNSPAGERMLLQPCLTAQVFSGASTTRIVKQKVDPAPSSDSTQIVPPNPSTSLLHIARPRPVPGTSRFAKRLKGRNTRA